MSNKLVSLEDVINSFDMSERYSKPEIMAIINALPITESKEHYGWVFKGRFFKDENDMRGMTMSEDNRPIEVFTYIFH